MSDDPYSRIPELIAFCIAVIVVVIGVTVILLHEWKVI